MTDLRVGGAHCVLQLPPIGRSGGYGYHPAADMETPIDVAELIGAAKAGDRAALETLFAAFYARVIRVAEVRLGRRLRQVLEPADIAQSVFGRALRGLPRYDDRGPGSFGTWLEAIVETTIREKARLLAAEKRGACKTEESPLTGAEQAASTRSPSRLAEKEEDVARLHEAMKTLTNHERRTVEVRAFLGLHGSAAAEALGVSEAAARQTYSRAMEKMGRFLAGPDESAERALSGPDVRDGPGIHAFRESTQAPDP